jgi:hypothetical protein
MGRITTKDGPTGAVPNEIGAAKSLGISDLHWGLAGGSNGDPSDVFAGRVAGAPSHFGAQV